MGVESLGSCYFREGIHQRPLQVTFKQSPEEHGRKHAKVCRKSISGKSYHKGKGHKGGRSVWCIQAVAERGASLKQEEKGRGLSIRRTEGPHRACM